MRPYRMPITDAPAAQVASPTISAWEVLTASSMRWFSPRGCLSAWGGKRRLHVGGTLLAEFDASDREVRDRWVVAMASTERVHLGRLAEAFELSAERVRQLRRAHEGSAAEPPGGRVGRGRARAGISAVQRRALELFAEGASTPSVCQALRGRRGASTTNVWRWRKAWERERAERSAEAAALVPAASGELALGVSSAAQPMAATPPEPPAMADAQPAAAGLRSGNGANEPQEPAQPGAAQAGRVEADGKAVEQPEAVAADDQAAGRAAERAGAERTDDVAGPLAPDEAQGAQVDVRESGPHTGSSVQHLGTWLMMAAVQRLGLHGKAIEMGRGRMDVTSLRVAMDATVAALSLGEGCVEGVRRVSTPTAPALLRATRAPSATWVRRVLGQFSRNDTGAMLHRALAAQWILEAEREDLTVFFVDNHMRRYTGQHVLRKGWRMQDKRAVPGATDYWVHDEDGRPLWRVEAPDHAPLTRYLTPISTILRLVLGPEARILVAFDRAGAYPEQMAGLRDLGVGFVTYERRPYPVLTPGQFQRTIDMDGEAVLLHDGQANLGAGRGRVRRLALGMPDRRQVNLLACSTEPAERLAEVMGTRWNQENALKHGAVRWGMNQLDGRRTLAYAPDAEIPNPARRRLDRALHLARVHEGDVRCALARLDAASLDRVAKEQDLEQVLRLEAELEAQRPKTPEHAPLSETSLAGRLVHHTQEYKATLDTIRIACANAEADLAGELGRFLPRPAEAKKTLRNLLAAPGNIRVHADRIEIELQPAGTRSEYRAFQSLAAIVNRMHVSMPADQANRPLAVRIPSP